MKVTPASSAARIVSTDCASGIEPRTPVSGAVPSPSLETCNAVRPTRATGRDPVIVHTPCIQREGCGALYNDCSPFFCCLSWRLMSVGPYIDYNRYSAGWVRLAGYGALPGIDTGDAASGTISTARWPMTYPYPELLPLLQFRCTADAYQRAITPYLRQGSNKRILISLIPATAEYWQLIPTYPYAQCPYCHTRYQNSVDTYSLWGWYSW